MAQSEVTTESYRSEMDLLTSFLDEYTTPLADLSTQTNKLYAAFQVGCEANRERAWSQTMLGMWLRERGFEKKKMKDTNYYLGIRIKDE